MTGKIRQNRLPFVLGHEGTTCHHPDNETRPPLTLTPNPPSRKGAGVIESLGSGVDTAGGKPIRVGDRVVLALLSTCGQCQRCATGQPYLCEENNQRIRTRCPASLQP